MLVQHRFDGILVLLSIERSSHDLIPLICKHLLIHIKLFTDLRNNFVLNLIKLLLPAVDLLGDFLLQSALRGLHFSIFLIQHCRIVNPFESGFKSLIVLHQ